MKPRALSHHASRLRSLAAGFASCARVALVGGFAVLAALPAPGATRFWDGGSVDIATDGDGTSDGTSGMWNTTLKNWDQGSGLEHVAWVNGGNTAEFNPSSAVRGG